MNELLKGVYTKYKSYIKIPNIYQSTEKFCSLPKIISGAIYSGFPIKLVPKSPSNNKILLFEKSTNLICPFSSNFHPSFSTYEYKSPPL